ncbi:hypothetical protein [Bdellovibrio svalbardensis]|uniref:Uncharacterized protein n=1 Tax=Bdellovibrio svalbardensis TaxID=2972972 RepID=A0ABT6DFC9_9BACT|nr:hypothetical protein [Bdellovibrio svalbardensis]MDG0815546.1 hypothetical protein [Bdellovibrio svalbardensis]
MFRLCAIALSSLFLLSACASGTFKARQEQREKMASSTGMYCEFVNGDTHPDIDVELNLQMARRCDANKNFSITNYKNVSDQIGVMYCCAMQGHEPRVSKRERSAPPAPAMTPAQPPVAAKQAPAAPASAPKADESNDEIVAE